jgi:hypothetical protein
LLTVAAIAVAGHLSPEITALSSGPAPAEASHTPLEGFGAVTRGGAGKPECVVTSLADSGAGTLRSCLAQSDRYIKFAVAGTIDLGSPLRVRSFITIDGMSAPSPGITLRGEALWIVDDDGAHDVIVSGIRVRNSGTHDCISVSGTVYNIVIDHVSVANCGDGSIDVAYGARNVTVQWSIAGGTKVHLFGSAGGNPIAHRISYHHNVIPGRTGRGPLVRPSGRQSTDTMVDLRNNIIRESMTDIESGAWVNLVGNTYVPEPGAPLADRFARVSIESGTRVFTAGNVELGPSSGPNYNSYGNLSTPLPAPPITARPAGCVLEHAGVRPLDDVDRSLLARFADVVLPACVDDDPPPPPIPTPRPDLAPRSLSVPSSGTPGGTISLSATIGNAGTATAPSSTARLYLSTDSTVSTGDAALGSISVPSLAPGATYTGTATVTVPVTTAAGAYMLLVRADDAGAITESNEGNNTVAIAVTVSPGPSGPFAVLLEAESMVSTSGMSLGFDSAALGGRYLSPTSGVSSTAPVREASVSVSIPTAGTYYLWARMYGPSPTADALYLGIGSSWDRAYPGAHGTYQWVRIETTNGSGAFGFQLAPGTHTIQVGRGEVNTRLDALYVTSSATDVPKFAPQTASFVPILLEAESMAVTSGMSLGSDSAALGGRYLSPTSGVSSTVPGREASVSVTVPTAGTYYLWARMYGQSGASDALYLGIGASWDRAYPGAHGTYQWVRIETTNGSGAFGFQLAPGTHTIQVGRGEVNTRLDAVYLTNSSSDVPAFAPQTVSGQTLR